MKKMNLKTTAMVAVTTLGIGAAQAVSVAWDNGGGDNSWQTAANWDNDTVPVAADDITIGTGAAVNYTPGGDLIVDGGSLTISGGSSWNQAVGNWSQINGGTLTLDNGTFTRSAGGNLVLAFSADDHGIINATNSLIDLGGELWLGHNNNTGNQTAQVNLTNSIIDANGVVGIWFWDSDAAGNSFSLNVNGAGSSVEGRVGRRNTGETSSAVTWETLWSEGLLKYDDSNSGVFSDHFTTSGTAGTGDYVLTSVPEPSAPILLGLGALVFILRRRK